ncbi:hypothetical protein [Streptomyces hypolithicus]
MTATPRTKSDEAAAAAGEPDRGDEVAAAEISKGVGPGVTDERAGRHADADAGAGAEAGAGAGAETGADAHAGDDGVHADAGDQAPRVSSGVASGAGAVASAVLGLAALTGTWISRVAAERETLIGQLGTAQGASPADQVAALYGNAWHMTALINGGFALLALLVAAVVLVRPAFGTPGAVRHAGWIRSVAWAGVAVGVLGLIMSAGMYLDLFASMPTPPAGTGAGAGQ